MGGGGGKSRSTEQSTTVQLPPGLEHGANEIMAAGMKTAALPYTPNRGITIAAFNPAQRAALRNQNQAAGAYGLETAPLAFMEAQRDPTTGIMGYSTGSLYDAMIEQSVSPELQERRAQILENYDRAADRIYASAGIDPLSRGEVIERGGGNLDAEAAMPGAFMYRPNSNAAQNARDYRNARDDRVTPGSRSSSNFAGSKWDGPMDMIDGGGPGKSGGSFKGGGLLSDAANIATGRATGRNKDDEDTA